MLAVGLRQGIELLADAFNTSLLLYLEIFEGSGSFDKSLHSVFNLLHIFLVKLTNFLSPTSSVECQNRNPKFRRFILSGVQIDARMENFFQITGIIKW